MLLYVHREHKGYWGLMERHLDFDTAPELRLLQRRLINALTAMIHLKIINDSAKFETFKPFRLLFLHWHVKRFSSERI